MTLNYLLSYLSLVDLSDAQVSRLSLLATIVAAVITAIIAVLALARPLLYQKSAALPAASMWTMVPSLLTITLPRS